MSCLKRKKYGPLASSITPKSGYFKGLVGWLFWRQGVDSLAQW